ncbi:hypothetical protein M3B39_004345 [Micrococcus luteus]|nr:hypothetical protein [Micrococcus luteus]
MSTARHPVVARQSSRESPSLMTCILVLMIFVGALQNAVVSFTAAASRITLADDLLLILAFMLAMVRQVSRPRMRLAAIGIYVFLCLLAVVRATVPFGLAFEVFRQLLVPALLVVIGMVITSREWRSALRAWFVVTVANIVYMLIEVEAGPILDPTAFVVNSGDESIVLQYQGLPGSYTYWNAEGEPALRVGGLFLNPPIAGLAVGIGAVAMFHTMRSRLRWIVLIGAFFAVYFSFSRAGMLVLGLGLFIPWFSKVLGRFVTTLLAVAGGFLFFNSFAADGGSEAHIEGFIHGLDSALSSPVGEGIGSAGNLIKTTLRASDSSESLTGIFLVATGAIGLLFLAVMTAVLARVVWRSMTTRWEPALAVAAFVVAAVAETAGALAGAAPMWIAVGLAFQREAKHRGSVAGWRVPPKRPQTREAHAGRLNRPGFVRGA